MPDEEQLRSAAADLVDLKSEVILVVTSPALRAAQGVTDTVPIVFVAVTDPVSQGFVATWRIQAATLRVSLLSNSP